ncbi:MAG TPA: TetR/AcrR family transcriptional regulator [Ktedonobacteraceae bacterium]|nr:TetR/AcrR family transcriptional regulator [Ktedonobacteraceae bacterium]
MCEMDRAPLRERNKQRNFRRIVDAALELFHTIGYTQTTMDAIAQKAEVSRATLFNYFPTKQALLMPIANKQYLERVQPEIQEYLDTQPSTLQALRRLFMSIYEHVLTQPGIYHALQQEFFRHEPDAKEAGTGFFETLLTILASGRLRDEVRTDIALEKIAHYVGALYVSQLFHPLEQASEQTSFTTYTAEIDALLAFLKTALSPGTAAGEKMKDL